MMRLKSAHSQADNAKTGAERIQALAALKTELRQLPVGLRAELVWLRQDLLARISGMELKQGNAEAALSAAGEGLSISESASVPVSNLHIAKGRALEEQGRKDAAAEAYYQALLVNEQLMQNALEDE
jgi:hypothetical protein